MSKLEDQLRKQRGTNLDTDRVEKKKKEEKEEQQDQRSGQEHSKERLDKKKEKFDKKNEELLDMFEALLKESSRLRKSIEELALTFSTVKEMNLEGIGKDSLSENQKKVLAEKIAQGEKSGKGEKTEGKNNKEEMGITLAEGAGLRELKKEINQLVDEKGSKPEEKPDSAKTKEQQEEILKKIEEALNRTDAEDRSETTLETKKKKGQGE